MGVSSTSLYVNECLVLPAKVVVIARGYLTGLFGVVLIDFASMKCSYFCRCFGWINEACPLGRIWFVNCIGVFAAACVS